MTKQLEEIASPSYSHEDRNEVSEIATGTDFEKARPFAEIKLTIRRTRN